jgi:hypothetical protein
MAARCTEAMQRPITADSLKAGMMTEKRMGRPCGGSGTPGERRFAVAARGHGVSASGCGWLWEEQWRWMKRSPFQ